MKTKTFRLFVSSPFSDFKFERKILQTKVFPFIHEYCANKGGYTFQPIDLRWGVTNEAQLNQKTLELCLNEVKSCKIHPHPNFLIMAGDRYGYIPCPYMIEESEFKKILDVITIEEMEILNYWYKVDKNQIYICSDNTESNAYILQTRKGKYIEYDNWLEQENDLRGILQKAAEYIFEDKSSKEYRKYFTSATEAEVEEGIFDYLEQTPFQEKILAENPDTASIDKEYVFGFLRNITNDLKDTIFIDNNYKQAQEFKDRIKSTIPHILETDTQRLNKTTLKDDYLAEFEKEIISFLKKSIDNAIIQIKEIPPLQAELQAQEYYAKKKRKNFIGREEILYIIKKDLEGSNDAIDLLDSIDSIINDEYTKNLFLIYGKSGSGKSSIMAKLIEQTQRANNSKVVFRFIGATKNSSSSTEILVSIFDELGINMRLENMQEEDFSGFSERVKIALLNLSAVDKKITIFIDAVDQLTNFDPFLWIPENLPENVKIIISALHDENYVDDSKCFETLRYRTNNLYEISNLENSITLLDKLLKQENRTLQKEQREFVLKKSGSIFPLYLSIAAEELKHWNSYSKNQELKSTQKGIIQEYISNLHDLYHHDKDLVKKVLGYLYASKDGLSESELLQLLSTETDFIEKVAPETWHENITKELPTVIWSRLLIQLQPFLSVKTQDNSELLYFFHREFENVVKHMTNQKEKHQQVIVATQKLIIQNQSLGFDTNRWGKLYTTLITEYYLRYQDRSFFDFPTQIQNKNWIKEYISYIHYIGVKHSKNNKMNYSKVFLEASYAYSKTLYTKDGVEWAEEYIQSLLSLAILYKNIEKFNEAILLCEKLVDTVEQLSKVDSSKWSNYYVDALINLGVIYQSIEQLDKAIIFCEKVTNILKNLYKTSSSYWINSNYVIALYNLAIIYHKLNQFDKAIQYAKQSWHIVSAQYRKEPVLWEKYYVKAYRIVSTIDSNIESLEESDSIGETVLETAKKVYKKNPSMWSEDYIITLHNIGVGYLQESDRGLALKYLKESMEIVENLYQQNPNRWVKIYVTVLASIAKAYGIRKSKGVEAYKKGFKIVKDQYKKQEERWTGDYIQFLIGLGFYYFNNNNTDNAFNMFKSALKVIEKSYQKNHDRWLTDYIVVLQVLAAAYSTSDMVDESKILYKIALNVLDEPSKKNPNQWEEIYDDLVFELKMLDDLD